MSKITKRSFKCMKCNHVYEINTYDSVNVYMEPELKERCLSGDIFHFECPSCHESYMLTYLCLYHDMEKRFMIWLSDNQSIINSLGEEMINQLLESNYTLRRCEDINSFIEKIQILDDGLDDRVVEFSKYDSYVDYTEKKKGSSENIEGIYYHGIENDILKINIKIEDKGTTFMIPYDALLAEMENHKDLFEIDDKKFPVIDPQWIIQIFDASQTKS